MDKKQGLVEARADQEEDAGISIQARENQRDLVIVKVAVEAKEKIDRRYKCRFRMSTPVGLKNLEDSRKVDSAGHLGEAEARYIT